MENNNQSDDEAIAKQAAAAEVKVGNAAKMKPIYGKSKKKKSKAPDVAALGGINLQELVR